MRRAKIVIVRNEVVHVLAPTVLARPEQRACGDESIDWRFSKRGGCFGKWPRGLRHADCPDKLRPLGPFVILAELHLLQTRADAQGIVETSALVPVESQGAACSPNRATGKRLSASRLTGEMELALHG